MGILIGIIMTIHVITCVLLVLIILMQRPKSEGLGTAFGGGVTENLFGAGAGNFLTKTTTWLGIIFFATTISLAYLYSHHERGGSSLQEKLKNLPVTETSSEKKPLAPAPSPPVPPSSPAPGASHSSSDNPPRKP